MASVYSRGSRGNPMWYARIMENGKWRSFPTHKDSKVEAQRFADEMQAKIDGGDPVRLKRKDQPLVGELLTTWLAGLTCRSANEDRWAVEKHIRPVFKALKISALSRERVIAWLDKVRIAKELAPATQNINLNRVSRFCGWAVERGYMSVNPVTQIARTSPSRPGKRPVKERGYINDATAIKLLRELRAPFQAMFYLGYTSGARLGECAGFRMSDLEFLEQGVVRCRYSYDSCLKEDKGNGAPLVKWLPAGADAKAFLGPYIARRKLQGAQAEDHLFPSPRRKGRAWSKMAINIAWREATAAAGVGADWYSCTRHSAASNALERGASMDEVSAALHHSSIAITERHYDHFQRTSYSATLTRGLGLDKPATLAPVHQLPAASGKG